MPENLKGSRLQGQFTFMVAQLIIFAYHNGYYITLGDAYAKPEDGRHSKNSFHYKRLAIDLNLFDAKTGAYLTETNDHELLGIFWESMGGTWGGCFKKPDGNHYSLGE